MKRRIEIFCPNCDTECKIYLAVGKYTGFEEQIAECPNCEWYISVNEFLDIAEGENMQVKKGKDVSIFCDRCNLKQVYNDGWEGEIRCCNCRKLLHLNIVFPD